MTPSLDATVDAALAARARLAGRPIRDTAAALAEAACRWCADPTLAAELPAAAGLSPAMIAHVVPIVAEAIDTDALLALHAREAPPNAGPALVAAVVASNVPALALPAIVHGCLAGAAVLVKSGRADTISAPAFRRELEAVDPALAATIVTAYWPGGTPDDAVLARADVVVATGGDATVAGIGRRFGDRVLAFGDRTSVAVVSRDASDAELVELARDVVRYEQRGCLSPQAVFVVGNPRPIGERLLAALEAVARNLPAPSPGVADRAAHRVALETARFAGAEIVAGGGGTVVLEPTARLSEPIGRRTVRVHALDDARRLGDVLPPGGVECIGVARDVALDVETLRARGVSRVCPLGRMQRPRIDWPRGQRPALASLFRVPTEPRIQVES